MPAIWTSRYCFVTVVVILVLGGAQVESKRCRSRAGGQQGAAANPRAPSWGERIVPWSKYPFVGKIFNEDKLLPCGVVFLTNRVILTAAHCLYDSNCKRIHTKQIRVSTFDQQVKHPILQVSQRTGYDCKGAWKEDVAALVSEAPMNLTRENLVAITPIEWCEKMKLYNIKQIAVRVFNGTELDKDLTTIDLVGGSCKDSEYESRHNSTYNVKCNPSASFPFRIELDGKGNLYGLAGKHPRRNGPCLYHGSRNNLLSHYLDWIYKY